MFSIKKINNKPIWNVMLDSRVVGKIHFENNQFQYFPKDSNPYGEKFDSLNAVITSLIGDQT